MLEIKILGKVYKVEISNNFKEHNSTDRGNVGLTQDKIIVDNTLCIDQQKETLLHEIIEVLNDSFEMDLKHCTISQLTAGLLQILLDNKKILENYFDENL